MQLCGSLNILWHCLSLGLEWKLAFSSPVATAEFFQICWHIECSTFTASSFRIWKSSTGIPSPPLALFIVMLSKAHLTSHSRMSGSSEWSHHRDYLGREDLFCSLVLEKAEEPVMKLSTSAGSSKKQESSRKTSISALLTMPKPLTVWITINCGKFWQRWEYQTTWPASWETCMRARKQKSELDME